MKRRVRLTESGLRRMVESAVRRVLREGEWGGFGPKPSVVKVECVDDGDVEDREVLVTLSNGTVVHIVPCYESWEQFGGTEAELYITMPAAEFFNDWLHGGEEPEWYNLSDIFGEDVYDDDYDYLAEY